MNDERITAYLLQELSQEEAERFEEECFAQEEWPAELDSVEQELIDAYLRDELTKERQQRFQDKYLITDARRERVLIAKSFLKVLCPPPKKTFKDKLQAFWQRPLVPQAAVVVLILAILGPVILSRLLAAKTYTRVDLAVASPERSGVGPKMETVKLPLSTNGLEIHLSLSQPSQTTSAYRVQLEDVNGNLNNLNVKTPDAQSVVVIIQANQLSPGKYVLKLFKTNRGETEQNVGSYFFKAEEAEAR